MTVHNLLEKEINVGKLTLKNRLVMPAMQTDKALMGRATQEMYKYYLDRAEYSRPGLIITGHCYIDEAGRVDQQMSIAHEDVIEDHYRIADAIHEGGSVALCQISHAGSKALPSLKGRVSASEVNTPSNLDDPAPRALEAAGVDLIDVTGGMCRYLRPGHTEPGYFGSMSAKIKAAVTVTVMVTGGVRSLDDVEALLEAGAGDLIGAGRVMYHDAYWGKRLESK